MGAVRRWRRPSLASASLAVAFVFGCLWIASRSNMPSSKGDERPEPGAETASVPNMTESLKAKVAVSVADQADPSRLASVYDGMYDRTWSENLNADAIRAVQQYYTGVSTGQPRPLPYADFPTSIPSGAVRLFVMFFQQLAPELTRLASLASRDFADAVRRADARQARVVREEAIAAGRDPPPEDEHPDPVSVHVNMPSHYHVTVFMTSQPYSLRGDPFDASVPPPQDPKDAVPTAALLERELEAGRQAARAVQVPPKLRAHKVLLADSGTFLLCLVDASETASLASLRQDIRDRFPNGPPRQSTIAHVSLARVLTDKPLSHAQLKAAKEACDRATAAVQGLEFVPTGIHHVQESTFTTVEGPRTFFPFGNQPEETPAPEKP